MAWQVGHPLKRDGTSQRERPLAALLPENNPIDARTIEDGLIYAYELAKEITYFDENNSSDNFWIEFFTNDTNKIKQLLEEKEEQDEREVEPHLALFITFLKLLEHLKEEMNGLTLRHLTFYYEEILGFKRQEAKPNIVHVLFQLARQKSNERIPEGTILLAGKDENKQPLFYKTKNEVIVNQATVKIARTIYAFNSVVTHVIPAKIPFSPFGTVLFPATKPLFMIGVEQVLPNSQLNIFFQIVEGTAEVQEGVDKIDIVWSYYNPPAFWTDFKSSEIIRDTTSNLQKAGIITFRTPENIVENSDGQFVIYGRWNTGNKSPLNVPKLLDVQTQAVIAEFENRNNAESHFENGLEANKIKNLQIRNAAIRKVKQPYESFGGKPAEQDKSFFARVSERLRHKQRAITIWDFEHLVLNAFSEIYKVKTISHTGRNEDETYSEFQPGEVEVVVIPQINDISLVNALEPKASNALRNQIHSYLTKYHSTFVELRVSNPRYEKIKLDFKVGFREDYDPSFYREVLNEAIKRYLSPWAYEEGADIAFGGRIYRSQLLTFV